MNYRPSPFPSLTPVVKNLLIITTLIFLAQVILARMFPITDMLALHYPASKSFGTYQLITYIFLHGDISHIFFNMFAVFMFGIAIEEHWGSARFLAFYMVTGIGAGLVQLAVAYFTIMYHSSFVTFDQLQDVYLNGHDLWAQNLNYIDIHKGAINTAINSSTIGASGAVFGILMAYGMIFPNRQMMLMFVPFPIKAKYMMLIYGVMEFYLGVARVQGDNVAHFAHLGGMLFAFFMIRYWRNKGIY
jgi:membrane associated rhomboid family serine protease